MFGFLRKRSWRKHFDRGMSAGGNGDLRGACGHFKTATELAPDEPYPHYELGYTLFLLGQHAEALRELKRTNELSPGFYAVQMEIYLCEGLLSGLLNEQNLSLLRKLQQLTDTGQSHSEEAISLSKQVIEAAPELALGHYYLGKALFESNRIQSEHALKRCLELGPDDTTTVDALTHIGLHREADGDLETAKRIWADVMNRYPDLPHTRMTELVATSRV